MNLKTQIKGLSSQRRLPRLGKIRLGVKAKSAKTGAEYPKETEYFVVPPEVAKVYGEKPTELDVLFPVEDTAIIAPQAYEWYGSGKGLKCIGDGETGLRFDDKTREMTEIECPCERLQSGECKQRMHIRVILPKVNIGGIYQIDTSSYNSIIDINSGLDYVRALIGRAVMVPLKLKRMPTETHHDGQKQTHYTLRVILDGDVNLINALRENTSKVLATAQYSLPAPAHDNPAADEGATVVEVEDIKVKQEQEIITIEFVMKKLEDAENVAHLKNIWNEYSPHFKKQSEDMKTIFNFFQERKEKIISQKGDIKEEDILFERKGGHYEGARIDGH